MLWKIFFELCYFASFFIFNSKQRAKFRKVQIYDWRSKYNALRRAFPELNFKNTRMIKGGWNIGFVVDNRYVFKIRKNYDDNAPQEKVLREKRITDALSSVSSVRILKIDIVNAGEYTFFKYDYIKGKNLNNFSQRIINKYCKKWGQQLGQFIYAIHNYKLNDIDDLKVSDGDGWNHNDLCNNIIVDKKTMNIVGIIDWEYSGWGYLETEFKNCTAFSKKLKKSDILTYVKKEYSDLELRA